MMKWLFYPNRYGVVEVFLTDGEFYVRAELSPDARYEVKYLIRLFESMVQRFNLRDSGAG